MTENSERSQIPLASNQRALPTWEECEQRVGDGSATPLERFIYHNEPADVDGADFAGADEFRRQLSAVLADIGPSPSETNCSDPGWEMRGGDLTCKGCGRKAREIFTAHDQEKASAAAVHLLSPKRCPDCGVQYVSGARHFSGCPSHPGESAQNGEGDVCR